MSPTSQPIDTYDSYEQVLPPLPSRSNSTELLNQATEPYLTPPLGTVRIQFRDFVMEPIVGMQYKLTVEGAEHIGITDDDGCAKVLSDLAPDANLEVFVFRGHTQDFKHIGTIYVHAGSSSYTIISPKIKIEITTQPHELAQENEAGVENSQTERSDKNNSTTANRVNTAAPVPATKEVRPQTPAPQVKPATPAPKVANSKPAQPQAPQTTQPKNTVIEYTRSSNGHPVANVIYTGKDWLMRNLLPVFNFMSWSALRRNANDPSQPHPAVNSTAKSSKPDEPKALASDKQTKLNKLIELAEEQTLTMFPKVQGLTAYAINEYKKHPPPTFEKKESKTPTGRCFAYVKVALVRAGYCGVLSGESPQKTTDIWEKAGFENVTSQIPKVETTLKNCVKLSDWDEFNHKDTSKERKAELQNVDYTRPQPFLLQTLPGDIIVYKQVDPPDPNAHGHIDIRTYDGFVSDFWLQSSMPPIGGRRLGGKRYDVIGIYRINSDIFAMRRVHAFLKIIREFEAEGVEDSQKYFLLPFLKGLTDKQLKHRFFSNTEYHPFNSKSPEYKQVVSTIGDGQKTAGAYQIKYSTQEEFIKSLGWSNSFGPSEQDKLSIALIQGKPPANPSLQ